MKSILNFIKWLFDSIFKLNTIKMVIVLLFLSFVIWLGYKAWIEKEEISIKSVETHSGAMLDENQDSIKVVE